MSQPLPQILILKTIGMMTMRTGMKIKESPDEDGNDKNKFKDSWDEDD